MSLELYVATLWPQVEHATHWSADPLRLQAANNVSSTEPVKTCQIPHLHTVP